MLLRLPAELLSSAMRACSVRGLARLQRVCHQLSLHVRQQADALLAELCAAGTTVAARASGAATIDGLARLCNRRPLVPRRFYRFLVENLCGKCVDLAALQRIFLVFSGMQIEHTFPQPYEYWYSADVGLGDLFRDFCQACLTVMDHSRSQHVTTSHVDQALALVFSKGLCHATRRLMQRLEDVDDEETPATEETDDASEELEFEENVVGVEIHGQDVQGEWHPEAASYFDQPFQDTFLGHHRAPCGCEGGSSERCHEPCQCRLASLLYGTAPAIAAVEAERSALGGRPVSDRWKPEVEAAIDLALHELACLTEPELAARAARGEAVHELRAVTSCPLALELRQEHAQYELWRAAGLADPVAALAAMHAPLAVKCVPLSEVQVGHRAYLR